MDAKAINALIEAVKLYPSLYSKQPANNGNSDQKNVIWKEISQKIDQPIERCKAKWRNLRDSYHKAVKRRLELEEIGRLSTYQEYRHEAALAFLGNNTGAKRKGSLLDDGKQLSYWDIAQFYFIQNNLLFSTKRVKEEMYESVFTVDSQDYSPSHEEYLIEADQNESQQDDDGLDGEEEQMFQVTAEDDNNYQEIPSVENASIVISDANEEKHFPTEVINEELPYQETYININEPLNNSSVDSLDPWLAGIKETLLSLPKLLRARAKKQINDLVSDFEINFLADAERK